MPVMHKNKNWINHFLQILQICLVNPISVPTEDPQAAHSRFFLNNYQVEANGPFPYLRILNINQQKIRTSNFSKFFKVLSNGNVKILASIVKNIFFNNFFILSKALKNSF